MRLHYQLAMLFMSACIAKPPQEALPNGRIASSSQASTRLSLPLQVDTGIIEVGPTRITVITTLVAPDTLEIAPPLVLNQHVSFSRSDTQTFEFDFAVERSVILYRKSFRVSGLDVYLNEIGIAPGKNQHLIVLQGYGGCDGCKVYTAIMNASGDTLYSQLRDKVQVYSESGDFREVVSHAGFSLQDYLAGRYPTTLIP